MSDDEQTSLRIYKDTHRDLIKIQGLIQHKAGKIISLDQVLQELISDYKKHHK